jgi:hypothetical protein
MQREVSYLCLTNWNDPVHKRRKGLLMTRPVVIIIDNQAATGLNVLACSWDMK